LAGYIIFFTITYMLAAEYLSLDPSKGEVLLFLHQSHLSKILRRRGGHDEESGPSQSMPQAPDSSHQEELTLNETSEKGAHSRIFHWSNVCYDISIAGEQKRILDHVDGWVKPGTLTALMVREPAFSCSLQE
jgi:ATP-binding cassette, subfamily G (WHITE), member 2, PDR